MGKILDTRVIIEIAKGNKNVLDCVISLDKEFYITSITRFEILVGFPKKIEILLINALKTLDFDGKSADVAFFIYKELTKKGKTPNIKDLFIASVCIANHTPLVSLDRDFKMFKEFGLDLELI